MAAWASWSLFISTKPKPLLRPVSRSLMTSALLTVPNALNNWSRSELETLKLRLPQYSFFPMMHFLPLEKVAARDLTFGAAEKGARNGGPPGGAAERGSQAADQKARQQRDTFAEPTDAIMACGAAKSRAI